MQITQLMVKEIKEENTNDNILALIKCIYGLVKDKTIGSSIITRI